MNTTSDQFTLELDSIYPDYSDIVNDDKIFYNNNPNIHQVNPKSMYLPQRKLRYDRHADMGYERHLNYGDDTFHKDIEYENYSIRPYEPLVEPSKPNNCSQEKESKKIKFEISQEHFIFIMVFLFIIFAIFLVKSTYTLLGKINELEQKLIESLQRMTSN
jgi:hypothetical protein